MIRFLATFAVVVVALFIAELTQPVQVALVLPWTEALVRISAGLIRLFDDHIVTLGTLMQSTRGGFVLSIEPGCNGIEAAIILIAAMLAFPAPALYRVVGIAAGLVAVQALNVVRVISLFYLGQWSMQAFEWAHFYLWQALIMFDVLIVWLVWIRRLPATFGLKRSRNSPPSTRCASRIPAGSSIETP